MRECGVRDPLENLTCHDIRRTQANRGPVLAHAIPCILFGCIEPGYLLLSFAKLPEIEPNQLQILVIF